jgi:hypothetical protein
MRNTLKCVFFSSSFFCERVHTNKNKAVVRTKSDDEYFQKNQYTRAHFLTCWQFISFYIFLLFAAPTEWTFG